MTESGPPSDEEEIRWAAYMCASQSGDQEAFEKLLREILPKVRSRVFGSMSGHQQGEDVVQNVLLSIHRSRHTYHPSRPFKPWLNAVTRNAVIDAIRARRDEWRLQALEDHDIPADTPWLGESEEISPRLKNALSQLPDAQRQAVELLHIDELTVREAAGKAGTSIGAFKVRAHRGRLRLREILMGRKP